MRVIHEHMLGDRKFTVRELTVGEIRVWLEGKSAEAPDLVDAFLFDEASLSDVAVLTDLTIGDMDGLAPSEIDQVIAKCKEANARFFAMRARLAEAGQKILARSQVSEPVA